MAGGDGVVVVMVKSICVHDYYMKFFLKDLKFK